MRWCFVGFSCVGERIRVFVVSGVYGGSLVTGYSLVAETRELTCLN